jgi:hypothetical protein
MPTGPSTSPGFDADARRTAARPRSATGRLLIGTCLGLALAALGGCSRPATQNGPAPPGRESLNDGAADSGDPLEIAFPGQRLALHLGPRETLLEPEKLKGLSYFPDMATVVLDRSPVRALVAGGAPSCAILVTGPDWKHLTSARKVLSPGGPGTFDNSYVGITGLYRHADGKLYAIYYCEDQEGMPVLGPQHGGIPGFYASQGLAVSTDNGESWKKLGQVITSSKPKDWTFYPGQSDRGAGVSGTVVTADGRWWYVYYEEHSRADDEGKNREVQICLARCPVGDKAPAPGSFVKYHNGEFSTPGLGGLDTPVLSAQADDQAQALMPHVVYMPALKKYVMILSINYWKEYIEKTGLKKSGSYIAFSDDGIRWSPPQRLLVDWAVPLEGRSLSWEATLVLDRDDGLDGWLLYAYSPRWGHTQSGNIPHYLVGRRVRFERLPGGDGRPP